MAQSFSRVFYESQRWRRCRAAYAGSVGYACEICGAPGAIVHHKVRLTPENINDPEVTLGWGNLELLCIPCHNRINIQPAVAEGLRFDGEGNLAEAPPSGG